MKNFSLITDGDIGLSPAYDLLSTQILMESDVEETALTIRGKKNKLSREDFEKFAEHVGLAKPAIKSRFDNLKKSLPGMIDLIDRSFVSDEYKERLKELIQLRKKKLSL